MELTIVALAILLALLAGLISMLITVAICYAFRSKKIDDISYFPFPGSRKDSVVQLKRHNVEDRMCQGPIGIMTPLVTPMTVQPTASTSQEDISVQPLLPDIEVFHEKELNQLGALNFRMEYSKQFEILKITVTLTHDGEYNCSSLVRVCLLPSKKYMIERKAKYSPIGHRWTEVFSFDHISFDENKLSKYTFYLQLCTYSNWNFKTIGEIYISVGHEILNEKLISNKVLQVPEISKLGEILLSLLYDNQHNDLIVSVIKTRSSESTEFSAESYVMISIFAGEITMAKNNTKLLPSHSNPTFNETFRFPLLKYSLKDISLVATLFRVVDTKISFGSVTLSTLSGGVATKQWTDMQKKPRYPILQWHKIG